MVKSAFTDFEAKITATGEVKVTFAAQKGRFFLDEVNIVDATATAIRDLGTDNALSGRIYTPDGRYVGTNINGLGHGLYIINGRKVMK